MAGRSADASRLVAEAHRLRDEQVGKVWFFPDEFSAQTLLGGGPAAAVRELQRAYDVQKRIGGTNYLSTIAALLARARHAEGRDEEAEQLTRDCEQAVRPNDVQANILWRGTRARILARRGRLDAAQALAAEAVAFAAQSDFLETHGDALVDLADVLQFAGRGVDARAALKRAVELYEQKGHVIAAATTRNLIGGGLGVTSPRS
jgi:tetratricopeptide (TPR) repeat protein